MKNRASKSVPKDKESVTKILDEITEFKKVSPRILQGMSKEDHLNSTRKAGTSAKLKHKNYYALGEFCYKYSLNISEGLNKIIEAFFSTIKPAVPQSLTKAMEIAITNINKAFSDWKEQNQEDNIGNTKE